ncbi:MAG: GNAT family N-acetyltransferase [Clostridiales bacterium]|nr:GNAT family N-acetyltransferase [Clostridiales bacterium]
MTEYRQALAGEESEILDFANMVFSMMDKPTDFRKLYPAVYGSNNFADFHLIAKDQERLIATVAVKPLQLKLFGQLALSCGYLGTVCTHPFEQGKGHMRKLLDMAVVQSRKQGLELLALSGQRQRYNHYDFENAGPIIAYCVNSSNLKSLFKEHQYTFQPLEYQESSVLDNLYAAYENLSMIGQRSKQLFKAYLAAWQGSCFVLLRNERAIGYIYSIGENILEMAIEDPSQTLQILYDWMDFKICKNFDIRVPAHCKDSIRMLGEAAESYLVSDSMMIHIFNWQSVIEKLLIFKSQFTYLLDGDAVIEITGEARLRIIVQSNRVTVKPTQKKVDAAFGHREGITRFFSAQGIMQEKNDVFYSWFPLMLSIPAADSF